jgi:hypothetical protein
MRKFMSRALLAAVMVTALLSAAPARAASEHCEGWNGCWTDPVPANRSTHHVHISLGAYNNWSVIDYYNRVVVSSGRSGFWGVNRTITGLYSWYQLRLGGLGGGDIDNN